jgi:hypothetical protein
LNGWKRWCRRWGDVSRARSEAQRDPSVRKSRVPLLHSHREYGKFHMGNQQDDRAIEQSIDGTSTRLRRRDAQNAGTVDPATKNVRGGGANGRAACGRAGKPSTDAHRRQRAIRYGSARSATPRTESSRGPGAGATSVPPASYSTCTGNSAARCTLRSAAAAQVAWFCHRGAPYAGARHRGHDRHLHPGGRGASEVAYRRAGDSHHGRSTVDSTPGPFRQLPPSITGSPASTSSHSTKR